MREPTFKFEDGCLHIEAPVTSYRLLMLHAQPLALDLVASNPALPSAPADRDALHRPDHQHS